VWGRIFYRDTAVTIKQAVAKLQQKQSKEKHKMINYCNFKKEAQLLGENKRQEPMFHYMGGVR
jgi:predicted transcriptional regulator